MKRLQTCRALAERLDLALLPNTERVPLKQWLRQYGEMLETNAPHQPGAFDGYDLAGLASIGLGAVAAAYLVEMIVGMGVVSAGLLGMRWLSFRRERRSNALVAAMASTIEDIRDLL